MDSSRSARARLALAAVAALALAVAGCVRYDVDLRIAPGGQVTLRERVAVDPEWKQMVEDSIDVGKMVIGRYVDEAKVRGGKVLRADRDSALVEFRYPSLAAFARAWPDSGDEGQLYDRAVYRCRQEGGQALDELVLFRMSPPDTTQRPRGARYPVLRFWITPPAPPVHQNAHFSSGGSYGWRFTENMTRPDSVWIAWPARVR